MKQQLEEHKIETKYLVTLEDFQNLKNGDFVACKFHRNIPWYTNCRFKLFEVHDNKERTHEIILEKKNNIYFNYEMFLQGESHLASILLIK